MQLFVFAALIGGISGFGTNTEGGLGSVTCTNSCSEGYYTFVCDGDDGYHCSSSTNVISFEDCTHTTGSCIEATWADWSDSTLYSMKSCDSDGRVYDPLFDDADCTSLDSAGTQGNAFLGDECNCF